MNEELQSLTCPLDSVNLIEAAAGTGKTYNIQNLVVRLLLERKLPMEQILLLTYTKAAAAELRDRIRRVISNTLNAPDERGKQLLEHAAANHCGAQEARKLLTRALRNFDDCNIGTIHSFCQRVLSENAFESSVRFRLELQGDCKCILQELTTDFFRRERYPETDAAIRQTLYDFHKFQIETVRKTAEKFISRPDLKPVTGNLTANLSTVIARLLRELKDGYRPERLIALSAILNKPYRTEELEAACAVLAEWTLSAKLLKTLILFAPAGMEMKRKAKCTPEEFQKRTSDPWFERCGKLAELLEQYRIDFFIRAIRFVKEHFEELKTRQSFQTYDDLIQRVRFALRSPGGRLLNKLRADFPAGIIDEFQDTDPAQYEIFSKLFIECEHPLFFMVGDPRQAIYAFRGGDIATYRQAARQCPRKYFLSANFRSSGPMISAVNRIFADHPNPFADPEIQFPEVSAPRKANRLPEPGIRYRGEECMFPLRIAEHSGNQEKNAELCAEAIANLLNDREWQLPDREQPGIKPSDIAVLVSNSSSANRILRELRLRNIPAVFTNMGNIFESPEAPELLSVMEAAADHGSVRKMIRALSGSLCNFSPAELIELRRGNDGANMQETFRKLGECWEQNAFFGMFRLFLETFDLPGVLLSRPNGERKLANVLQLGDILQQLSLREHLPMNALIARFARMIASPQLADADESEQLLDSDRPAVKLITIHSSKGLEYPVVIAPDLWAQKASDPEKLGEIHDRDGTLIYDFTNSQTTRAQAICERRQELLRLSYVAMTRAKYYLLLMRGKSNSDSALDHLLNGRENELKDWRVALMESPERSNYHPPVPMPETLECRRFSGQIERNWKISSYSGITPEGNWENLFDYDENDAEYAGESSTSGRELIDFPGGPATGNAWHKIMETLDFTESDADARHYLVGAKLNAFGLLGDPETAPERIALTEMMVKNLLNAPLNGADGVFTLAQIGRKHRVSEMEFLFAFHTPLSLKKLESSLSVYARERFQLERWPESSANFSGGFFTGFADLLFEHGGKFYIVDWKSNRLKGCLRNFEPENLTVTMRDDFYFLQYLLYIVAWMKFMRLRLGAFGKAEYEQYFGGVFYLFMRGVSPEHPGRGIFAERPPFDVVHALENALE